jgi:hypothetical protein
MDDLDRLGAAYLEHLTEADLRALVHADEVSAAEAEIRMGALRRQPSLLLDVLDRPAVSADLLNLASADALTSAGVGQNFTFISPFLVFAAAVHRIAADLRGSGYVPERTAPGLRLPVFDGPQLAAYLAAPEHRLFLAELLASFARSSSGVILTRTPQGLRRRRWSDLDLSRLVMLLEAVPDADRPPVWRRLGDLALFMLGVFPASVERLMTGRLDPVRLARLTGLTAPPRSAGPAELTEWLGAGWYRLAARRTPPATAPAAAAASSPSAQQPADSAPGSVTVGAVKQAGVATAETLLDNAETIHQARRVLNAVTDRYLFPVSTDWFSPPR